MTKNLKGLSLTSITKLVQSGSHQNVTQEVAEP